MNGGLYNTEMATNESLVLSASVYSSGSLRDLSSYTGTFTMREGLGSTSTVLVSTGTQLSITTGTVGVNIPASFVADALDNGVYVYDIILSDETMVERLLYGTITVHQGVS